MALELDHLTEDEAKGLVKFILMIYCITPFVVLIAPFFSGGYWLFVGIPRCIYRACKKLYKRIKYGSVKTTELQKNELKTDTKQ